MVSNQIYPQKSYINDITNAIEAVVTFTADHDFTLGELVSFRVSSDFGMREINNISGRVIAKTDDTITVPIDTTDWTPFDYSALNSEGSTPPVCVPCCSGIIPSTNPSQINQQAAFDNRRT